MRLTVLKQALRRAGTTPCKKGKNRLELLARCPFFWEVNRMKFVWHEIESKEPLEVDFYREQRNKLIKELKLEEVYDPYWEEAS